MAVYKCPSCGARYNGKRCRSCLYEHFTEEISHGNHVHEGEPLVIEAPVRKPIRRKNPFECDTRTRRKTPRLPVGIATILVVLSLIGPVLEGVFSAVEDVTDSFSISRREPEPEIAFPESGTVLFREQGLEVVTTWTDDQPIGDSIPIYIRNETGEDIVLSARDVILNDCMSGGSYLHCDLRNNRTGNAQLRISQADMARSGIAAVRQLQLCLDVMEQDTYKTLMYSDPITITPQDPGPDTDQIPQGIRLYHDDRVTISCLGYEVDEYHPDELWEGTILFHLENHSDQRLEIWTPMVTLNGEDIDLNLWAELCPNTRSVALMYLFSLEEAPVNPDALLESLAVTFSISAAGSSEASLTTEALPLNGT